MFCGKYFLQTHLCSKTKCGQSCIYGCRHKKLQHCSMPMQLDTVNHTYKAHKHNIRFGLQKQIENACCIS